MTSTENSVRVFGGIGVDGVDGPVSIGGPRQRRLLALLVVRLEVVATNDWLAEHLWNDEDRPKATASAIRTYMSRLRRALPAEAQEWIETESSGYRWVGPVDAVEHRRFALLRSAATQARRTEDPQTALGLLDEALGLWRGDPFRELEDLDWARTDIEQLRLDRLEMQEERWEAALALGRHTQITGELAAFTAEHRLRDRSARQYALALHRSGRTTEALRVIAAHRETLAEESGLDPSPDVVELEAALLAGDASLDVEKVGRPLRGYRLLEEIGSGAFSVVWRGIQPSVNREVAIKQIRSDLASQPEFIRRFEAEAHLIARIEHPYIVPLIDYWRDPDSAYLVMRWLRGGTLERALDNGPLTVTQTMTVARQIGGALAAAHAQGVVHRDVKTSNILCDEQQNAFLADFGIALEATKSSGPEAALSPGSPAYASPEQIRQERLDAPADLFSLGVVLYECLAGELPFPKTPSVAELTELQLNTPYPKLAELRSDVPAAVSAAIAKATAKNPEDRYGSIDEFLDALGADSTESAENTDSPAAAAAVVDAANPYKGLRAFDSGDTARFFGRERLVTELTNRLGGTGVSSRCLVIVGPSGSGKSSVARAGLVPAIRGGAVEGSDDWFVTTMTPATDPYEALEAALLRIAVNPPPSLIEQLRSGPRGIVRGLRRCLTSDNDQVLVVVDQFEELFTSATPEDADEFLSALSVAVDDPTSPLRLVATLRADFYDRPLEHPTFAPVLKDTAVDVTPLAPDELERAIVEPARQLGVEFEPGLVARIAAEATGQPSPLPLLQFALSALFDHCDGNQLTTSAYEEIGGLTGALAARAESIYLRADDTQRQAIRRVFGRMTNPGEEATDLRRRVPLSDLGDDPASEWVLEHLGTARLVTFDRDVASREPTVEVAHEALLREWPRLVAWLTEDLDVLRSTDVIGAAAVTWDDGGREITDLYRGGRLQNAVDLALSTPDRLRPIDSEFIEASRALAESERRSERYRIRRLRRLVAGVGAALVIALIAGGVAFSQRNRANDQARQAELATIISRSAAVSADDPEVSLLLALEAHRREPGPETEQAVLNALGSGTVANRVSSIGPIYGPSGSCEAFLNSSDGTTQFGVSNNQMVSRDSLTGEVIEHGPPPEPCVVWIGDEQADRRVAGSIDGLRMWLGPYDGPWEIEEEFAEPTFLVERSLDATNVFLMVTAPVGPALLPEDGSVLMLLDATTGEPVGTPIRGGVEFLSEAASADGSLIAIGYGIPAGPDGDGLTIVVDGNTGEEIFRIMTPLPAGALTFDEDAGQLIAAIIDGSMVTIDLSVGEIVLEVETTTTSFPLAIGVRPDGLVVSVASGQIELVDRATGPAGLQVELRDVGFARVRPDGTVLTVTADDQTEILDLNGNALVEQTWEVDTFGVVAFNAGRAGVVNWPNGNPEVIDLATGDRSTTELIMPEGDRFAARTAFPESDGVWAFDIGGVLTRWEGGQLVERIDLGGTPNGEARYNDIWAFGTSPSEEELLLTLVNLESGEAVAVIDFPTPDSFSSAYPSLDGGLYAIDTDGTLHSYDSSGAKTGEIETDAVSANILAVDPASGKLAAGVGDGSAAIIDPETGDLERLPGVPGFSNIAFARNGQLLAITSSDGTVRLWDVERQASAGLVWDGSGVQRQGSAPWYDESTESIWVASSGKLLRVPLNPERWIERACEIVGRDLTQDEWDRFVPGDGAAQSGCS